MEAPVTNAVAAVARSVGLIINQSSIRSAHAQDELGTEMVGEVSISVPELLDKTGMKIHGECCLLHCFLFYPICGVSDYY